MADFEKAFKGTMAHEGGYVNDPTDRGGETYHGISRKAHPDWLGWKILDEEGIDADSKRKELESLVRNLYRSLYWDRVYGDEITDQAVADQLFDFAVNSGPKKAVRYLQRALNSLNRDGQSWSDIALDGKLGPLTMMVLKSCLESEADVLLVMLENLRGARFVEIGERDPTQKRFMRGWQKRTRTG